MSPVAPSQPFAAAPGSLLEFETAISDLSSGFINLPAGEVDQAIDDALRRVCEPLGIDLAVLWQWSSAVPGVIVPTHFHYAQEGAPPPEPLRQEQFPWYREQMMAGRKVAISSLDELPAEASVDRESCRLFGVKSNLCLPLSVGGAPPVGALGLNFLRKQRDWPDGLVRRLQLVAQVFTNALARKRYELRQRDREARLAAGVDLAGLGFYEVDLGAGVASFDDRLCSLLGVPPERMSSLQPVEFWLEHLHSDDRQRVTDQRQELHEGRLEKLSMEYRFLHPNHGERWIEHAARVDTRDAGRRAVRTFGVLRDVTERRQREENLRQSHAEIQRLKDRLQAERDYLKAEILVVYQKGEITGQSPAIQKVLRLVERVASTDSTVLVRGETGSGKELVAQAIHQQGTRRSHLLVKVNCAALPSGLVESELFGREKGAYTGSMTRQIGRFEVADGSTLFLDEVGELSLEAQAKLLRVLETGEFERLGSPRTIKVNVRVIAATNRDLAEDVRKGRFRQDLYYRLNVFPILVPPLRDRVEDIPLMVWTFLEEFTSRMGRTITQVPRTAMDALQRHPWPGNVRELRNVIERSVILTTGETLRVPMLDDAALDEAPEPTLADSERELILRALDRTSWRIKGPTGAAAALGLHPSTLYNRMKKLGVRPPGQAGEDPS